MTQHPVLRPAHGLRQIHLDFHNSSAVGAVGEDFDAERFAQTMADATVTGVNLFAKCHHGYSYYPTRVGTKHPGLNRDLLGEQIEALHRRGIKAPVYVSVLWDDLAGESHPEWVVMDSSGRAAARAPFTNHSPLNNQQGWTTLDLASGYGDYVIDQLRELMDLYPIDGFWLDIVWAQPNYSPQSLARLVSLGVDVEDPREMERSAEVTVLDWMERVGRAVSERLPNATLFFNGSVDAAARDRMAWQSHLEVESLPTSGDVWGYMHFPVMAKHVSTLPRPMVGMTGRFHRSWADFGGVKTSAQLDYECGTIVAAGAGVSIGDQLDPSGVLDEAVYRTIGAAFAKIEALEPYLDGGSRIAEIAILASKRREFAGMHESTVFSAEVEGAVQLLLDLHVQFSIVDEDDVALDSFACVIVTDGHRFSEAGKARIEAARAGGTKLIVVGDGGLDSSTSTFALAGIPVDYQGLMPTDPGYLVLGDLARNHDELDQTYPYALYGRAHRVSAASSARAFGDIVPSRFDRTWRHFTSHAHAPVGAPIGAPLAVMSDSVLYLAAPLFALYRSENYWVYREVFSQLINEFAVDRTITGSTNAQVEVTVYRRANETLSEDRLLHLVPFAARRSFSSVPRVDSAVAFADVTIGIALPGVQAIRARTVPDGLPLSVKGTEGRFDITIDVLKGHTLVEVTTQE